MSINKFYLDGERLNRNDSRIGGADVDVFGEQVGGADDEEEADQPITIKVRDQGGEEMMFKVKKGTKMTKIFSAYAQRKGVDPKALRFTYDGERVNEGDTPKMLEMEDGDQVDSVIEQVGGAVDGDDDEGEVDQPITIKVRDQGGEEMMFKVKKGTKMAKIFTAYATRKGVDASALRFSYDGVRVKEGDTPKMLEMEDGDLVDSVIEQVGGADDEEEADQPITIKVRDQGGEEMMFKVKKGTKMTKIFSAYAQRKGVELTALRFTYDGVRVNEQDTPKMLEMEDGDQVDSIIEQVGGI